MQAIAITHPGLEPITEKEIKEIIKPKNIKQDESVVVFEPNELIDLCTLCYLGQSMIKILLLKKKVVIKSEEDIFNAVKKIDFSDFISGNTFKVKCIRIGEHELTSPEIEQGAGENIEGKVDLENPDVIVYIYLYGKTCYIGIDFAGFDLSKRQYRIFNYREKLKATAAYALLRIADYSPEDYLLDPFCSSGTIAIEAALFACRYPVNFFNKEKFAFLNFNCFNEKKEKIDFDRFFEGIDKKIDIKKKTIITGYDAMLGYVKASQKNSKIAGINKKISFSRADVEWLDTKIKKNTVDKIVTHPPQLTERNQKNIEKIYSEFFHQAEFIMKKNGIILLAAESKQSADLMNKFAKEYKFRPKNSIKMMEGKKEIEIILFEKP